MEQAGRLVTTEKYQGRRFNCGKKAAKDDARHEHSFYEHFCSHLKKFFLMVRRQQKVLERKNEANNCTGKNLAEKAQEDGFIKKKSKPVK